MGDTLPVGDSDRLPVERRPRRVRKRSLTFLACSSSSRFFCRSSSESCSSGSWSFTRSITLPVLSEEGTAHVYTDRNIQRKLRMSRQLKQTNKIIASENKGICAQKKWKLLDSGHISEKSLMLKKISLISAGKSCEEEWSNQRCYFKLFLSPPKQQHRQSIWSMCGNMQTVSPFFNLLSWSVSVLWINCTQRLWKVNMNWTTKILWRVCVLCVSVWTCSVTHRLSWLVPRMSFWLNDSGDCEAWESKHWWFRHVSHVYASRAGKYLGVGTWFGRGDVHLVGPWWPAVGRRWWGWSWWRLDFRLASTDETRKTWNVSL